MKRLNLLNKIDSVNSTGINKSLIKNYLLNKNILKWILRIAAVSSALLVVVVIVGYLVAVRPILTVAAEAKKVKGKIGVIKEGLREQNFSRVSEGFRVTNKELEAFKKVYEKNLVTLRKIPGVESYYQDGERLIAVAEQSLVLGQLVIEILEPYAADIGFVTDDGIVANVSAQDRVIKLVRLMPQFSPRVSEISDAFRNIDLELQQINASRYPRALPGFVKYFGFDPSLNVRGQVLAIQSVSSEMAQKSPQFETLFNSMPEFMGVNEPKQYLVLMANNYELRMSGGFNTYIVVVQLQNGIPEILYSIDTYFLDEGDRVGSSALVSRNVPHFLRNYLYLSGNAFRLYARDATSTSPDFPTAANRLLNDFWRKDRTLPQELDGVIQINNDIVVNLLKVVGSVNTESYSVLTDQRSRIKVPITEFNSDNVIMELENIAGGKLAETIGRKDIIKFLAQSILGKIFTSEATNLANIAQVMVESLSKKDVILYSFDPIVQKAFEDLGYGGKIKEVPSTWDYLHVNRSNFGAGKADWAKEGFVTQDVKKDVIVKDGKRIGTVGVTIHNPKRPSWYNIDPCCFYNAYLRVYVPLGSKLISIDTSDGQNANGTEFVDEEMQKVYFETFTRQLKETNLTINFTYELPDLIDLDDYRLLIQRQPGTSVDKYTIGVEGVGKDVLLNSDKVIQF